MKTAPIHTFVLVALLVFGMYHKGSTCPVPVPSKPVDSGIATITSGSRCGAGKVELHATANNPSDTIKWYNRITGGSPIGKGESWTTPIISSTTTYYVCAKKGSSRKAVKATINALPPAVIIPAGTTSFCEGTNIVLTISAEASAFEWSTGATTSAIAVTAAGNYSVRISNASGCSATSPVTTVTVTPYPHIVSITPGLRCDP